MDVVFVLYFPSEPAFMFTILSSDTWCSGANVRYQYTIYSTHYIAYRYIGFYRITVKIADNCKARENAAVYCSSESIEPIYNKYIYRNLIMYS